MNTFIWYFFIPFHFSLTFLHTFIFIFFFTFFFICKMNNSELFARFYLFIFMRFSSFNLISQIFLSWTWQIFWSEKVSGKRIDLKQLKGWKEFENVSHINLKLFSSSSSSSFWILSRLNELILSFCFASVHFD